MNLPEAMANASWPLDQVREAIRALGQAAGFPLPTAPSQCAPDCPADPKQVDQWIAALAAQLGLEALPVDTSYGQVDCFLRGAGPALLRIHDGVATRFLALASGNRKNVIVLGPDLRRRSLPLESIRAELSAALEAPCAATIETVLDQAAIHGSHRASIRAALLKQQLSAARISGCWLLRLLPGASWWALLRAAGLKRHFAGLIGGHTGECVLWVLAWFTIGKGALQGRMDSGWLLGCALLLACMVASRMLVTWSGGNIAVRGGALIRERLLYGALRLKPEDIRHQGVGQLLGRALEAEAVESLALSSGFPGLLAAVELILAAVVLGMGAAGWKHALLLLTWTAGVLWMAWSYWRRRQRWTRSRLALTNDLVERMAGHRTRLAQELPSRWHLGEDELVEEYQSLSAQIDQRAIHLIAIAPRAWLVIGLAGLIPAFVFGNASPVALAVSLGGLLLAYRALQRLGIGLNHLAGAAIAYEQVAPLLDAAAQKSAQASPGLPTPCGGGDQSCVQQGNLITALNLVFRYRNRNEPVLRNCNLYVRPGDRVLLQGPSGGGKSTVCAVLAGWRQPESGLLLLDGLDRRTLGDERWRRRVAAAPQFHENHVLTGTFAFNLLMGRQWPPDPGELEEAEALCEELGLGELLQRMPAGLMQVVGETGWQLSNGEKSRLYIARALLQGAELVILDESFASLDSENLRRTSACVLARARTLLVVAHP